MRVGGGAGRDPHPGLDALKAREAHLEGEVLVDGIEGHERGRGRSVDRLPCRGPGSDDGREGSAAWAAEEGYGSWPPAVLARAPAARAVKAGA